MTHDDRLASRRPPTTGRPEGVEITPETQHDERLEEAQGDGDQGWPGAGPYGQHSSAGPTVGHTASTEDSGNLGAAPAAGGPADLPPLFEGPQTKELQQRWHEIQAAFVDDPHDAVRQAGALNDEIVNSLTRALDDRKRGLESGIEKGDTEQLRVAMRQYRRMLDQILTL